MQASPPAGRPQYGFPSPFKGKAGPKFSETLLLPHLPAFTVLPTHPDNVNLRALAQSSRYIAAQSKAKETRDVAGDDAQPDKDVSTIQGAQAGSKYSITPQEQDLNAAGILVEVAREQHPISTILVKERDASYASATMEHSRKCPVTTCPYHVQKVPWLKRERDNHILTHLRGHIESDRTDFTRISI